MIYLNVWGLLVGISIGIAAILEVVCDIRAFHLLPTALICETEACIIFWINSPSVVRYDSSYIVIPTILSIGWYTGPKLMGGNWPLDYIFIAVISFFTAALAICLLNGLTYVKKYSFRD